MNRLRRQVANAGSKRSPQRRLGAVESQMRRHGCNSGSRHAGGSRNATARSGNQYQTVCVRKCDGYYFPVGYATPKRKLERDQAVCDAFYPDGAAELYIHPTGSEKGEAAMTSLEGEAYADKSFAFAYRSAYQPACAALLRDGIQVERPIEEGETVVAVDLSTAVPLPVPRPTLSDNSLDVADSERSAKKDDAAEVRVVGPATPYLVGEPADGAAVPVASAPERIQPETTWLEQLSSLIAPPAQADETTR